MKDPKGGKRRIKLTRHNGRSGRNGVYNPKHNDRRFNIKNSDHIDSERAAGNIYWDWHNGFRTSDGQGDDHDEISFEDVEKIFYEQHYGDYVEAQNARNAKTRHTERNRSTDDLLKNMKTCPEETIYQIGTIDDHISEKELFSIVMEFMNELNTRFGDHLHILDFALHVDESSPHIHERHVFDCENRYGEVCPQQEKALEALGFELPDSSKKMSRSNNRKIAFDSACRALLFDICKKHGLQLEEEPEYGGRKYLEKQDYIRMKQQDLIREQNKTIDSQIRKMTDNHSYIEFQDKILQSVEADVSRQQDRLQQLNMQIEDVEELIDEVSDLAYDKAVEVVAEAVQVQTRKEDIAIIQSHQDWLNSGEKKFSRQHLKYSNMTLDRIKQKLMSAAERVLRKVRASLDDPVVKRNQTEAIKKKVRPSVLARLTEKKGIVSDRNTDGRQTEKKKLFGIED